MVRPGLTYFTSLKPQVWFPSFKYCFVCSYVCVCRVFVYEGRHRSWYSDSGQKATWVPVLIWLPVWGSLVCSCVTCSTVVDLRVSGGLSCLYLPLCSRSSDTLAFTWVQGYQTCLANSPASSFLHSKRRACYYIMIRSFISLKSNEPFKDNINKTKCFSYNRLSPIPIGRHQSSLWRLTDIGKNWARILSFMYKLKFRMIMLH